MNSNDILGELSDGRQFHLFFTAVGPLLGDDAYSVVSKNTDAEDGDAAAVDELHGLDCKNCGDDVVHVVLAAGHGHQTVARATDKHQAWKG